MGYFNEFPHTRIYDGDLGWLIKIYKELLARYKSNNEYLEEINQKIEDMTEEQLKEWLDDGTLEDLISKLLLKVAYYNTTTELLASNLVQPDTLVFTLGYNTIYDKGGSCFYISNTKENENSLTLSVDGLFANYLDDDLSIEQLGLVEEAITSSQLVALMENNPLLYIRKNHSISGTLIMPQNTILDGLNNQFTFTNTIYMDSGCSLINMTITNSDTDIISFNPAVNNSTQNTLIENVKINGVNRQHNAISFNAPMIDTVLGGGLLGKYRDINIDNCNYGILFDTSNAWYTVGFFENLYITHCIRSFVMRGTNQLSDVYVDNSTFIQYEDGSAGIEHNSGSVTFNNLSIFNDLFTDGTAYSLYLLEPASYVSFNQNMSFTNCKLEGAIKFPYLIDWYKFTNCFLVNRKNATQDNPMNSSLSRYHPNINLVPEYEFSEYKTINISTAMGRDQYGPFIELRLTDSGKDGYFYFELGANFLRNINYGNYVTNYIEYSTVDRSKVQLFLNNYASINNKFEYDEMLNIFLYEDFNHRFKYTSTIPNLEEQYQEHNDFAIHLLAGASTVNIYRCVCKLGLFIL